MFVLNYTGGGDDGDGIIIATAGFIFGQPTDRPNDTRLAPIRASLPR